MGVLFAKRHEFIFKYGDLTDLKQIRKRLYNYILEHEIPSGFFIIIGINEAIRNSIYSGNNGQKKIEFRISKHKKIFVRITDHEEGFNRKLLVRKYSQTERNLFEKEKYHEDGRGIILTEVFDHVVSNNKGTDLLLVKG